MSIFAATWTPEPETAPVDPYGPLYASWVEAGPRAMFEIEMQDRYGYAPRYFQADAQTAITYHRMGYRVSRVS